jgi:hypothetical protein
VLRDLLRLQHTKELSFGERKLLENALAARARARRGRGRRHRRDRSLDPRGGEVRVLGSPRAARRSGSIGA